MENLSIKLQSLKIIVSMNKFLIQAYLTRWLLLNVTVSLIVNLMLRVESKLIKVKNIHNDTNKEIIAFNENYDDFSDHIQQYMNH